MRLQQPFHRALVCLVLFLLVYVLLIGSFVAAMATRPIEEKLGYVPSASMIRPLSAGMYEFSAASLVMKVMMYFGGLFDKNPHRVEQPPDYEGMAQLLEGAVTLDPYNMDAYYFAQAFLVWDHAQVERANRMLDHGMQYRSWDWYLPFFAGFNSSYFLKDFNKAAQYYKRAADLTGAQLFVGLTGRYLQEAGETALAINYLQGMLAVARTEVEREHYRVRLEAFEAVRRIELAQDQYYQREGSLPKDVDQLISSGDLESIPTDPYGGVFYLMEDGRVATTSRFAFGVVEREGLSK